MKRSHFSVFVLVFNFIIVLAVFENIKIKTGIQLWQNDEEGITKLPPETIKTFHSSCTYIVLKTDRNLVHTIHYLIGSDSEYNLRFKTVNYVLELRDKLIPNTSENILIIRETQGKETNRFTEIFPKITNTPVRRMYKMTTIKNVLAIVQVPPSFSELTRSDVFLLDTGSLYYTFNVKTENDLYYLKEKKKLMTQNLIDYIRDFIENNIINIEVDFSMELDESIQYFFSLLEGSSVEKKIDNILPNKKEKAKQIILYELPEDSDSFNIKRISVLKYENLFPTKRCFILRKERVNEVFIVINSNTSFKNNALCLQMGENLTKEEYLLVSVIQDNNIPAPFMVIFSDSWISFAKNYDQQY